MCNVHERVFSKPTLAGQLFAKIVCAKFYKNPIDGLAAVIV